MGEHWLLKQLRLNHPVEHIQKPNVAKLYVRVETSTTYFIIHVENGLLHRKMVVDCPIVIKSIGDTLFQTKPGMRNHWQASLLLS